MKHKFTTGEHIDVLIDGLATMPLSYWLLVAIGLVMNLAGSVWPISLLRRD